MVALPWKNYTCYALLKIICIVLVESVLVITGCSRRKSDVEPAPIADLRPYTVCKFPDGLEVVEVDPLAPGVKARMVETATGLKQITLMSGLRIMLAYPHGDFFANVKAEKLPVSEYPQLKQRLIKNLDYVLASSPTNRRNTHISAMKNLEAYGLDRDRLEGGVIGIYLLFNNQKQIATTVYFLNQESSRRKFQNMDQYAGLRDSFLSSYAACIQKNSE